nr:hypothetical protein Iba_chr12aCG12890 [Ipomoea batatas]
MHTSVTQNFIEAIDEIVHRWNDVTAIAREYDECEERQGGDEIQAGDDRGHEVETAQASEGEVGEHRAHASERAQQIEVEIVAPTDEIYTIVNPQGEKESRYKHFSSRYFEDKALAMDAPMA